MLKYQRVLYLLLSRRDTEKHGFVHKRVFKFNVCFVEFLFSVCYNSD